MDDLRAAVDRALALTASTRLIAIDAAGLVAADGLAVYAAFGAADDPRGVIADPLRLPMIEGVADGVLVQTDLTTEPRERLREIWRILSPAGILVVVVPLPPIATLKGLIIRPFRRRRAVRTLAAAMFAVDRVEATAAALVIRAGKRDGFAPIDKRAYPANSVAIAPAARVRTNTA